MNNVRSDMLRQSQPPILGLNGNPFLQNPAQAGQQQQQPMSMPPNSNNSHPPMGMLGPNPNNPMNPQRYPMQMQGGSIQQQRQQQMMMRQGQPGQPMNPATGNMPGHHIAGMNHNQLQGMQFSGNMMPQGGNNVGVRRVASQGQINPGAHLGGLPQGVNGNMSMGMNPQTSMPAQLRQAQAVAQQQMRQQQLAGHMSPEMAMGMNRPGGNMSLSQNAGRAGSAPMPLMNSLSQPPSHGQPPNVDGMSPSHHQNNFPNSVPLPMQHQTPQLSSSPRPGSHPQSHTPTITMAGQGPSHSPMNRAHTHMVSGNFNNRVSPSYMPSTPSNGGRIPNGNGQFSFGPSSPPDMPQSNAGFVNTPGGGPGSSFHLTPAQQFQQMQHNNETYASFGMSPGDAPPRPPSHNNQHPSMPPQQIPSQQHHHSPNASDSMNIYPTRPQSQPQARPSSQPGPSHTPRPQQPQVPSNAGGVPSRMPPSHNVGSQQGMPPQPSGSSQPLTIAPRPPTQPAVGPSVGSSPASSTTQSSEPSVTGGTSIPRAPANPVSLALGNGQGLIRLLQFSGNLSNENKTKLQLSWWNDLIKEFFTPKAVMKFTLWKDNQRNEAKPFEIGVPILPRFFLVTTQSGVKSMTLTLDGARERMYAHGHAIVECVTAVWTYKYNNGYIVTLRGPLTAHIVITAQNPPGGASAPASGPPYVLKFEDFQFDATWHDKYISLDAIMGSRTMESPTSLQTRNPSTPMPNGSATPAQQGEEDKKWEEPRVIIDRAAIPGEPVNAFGIPQATMRCLELAESVAQMADLITFSSDKNLGPIDALSKFAIKLRENPNLHPGPMPMMNGLNHTTSIHSGGPPHPFASYGNPNGVPPPSPAVTLYSSAPASVTNPSSAPTTSTMSSPQNAPPSASSSPRKQHKTIPQPPQNAQPSASTPASTGNTPSLSNASLKRKQASDATSPSTGASEQPPPKRVTRKRGRTTGGGG